MRRPPLRGFDGLVIIVAGERGIGTGKLVLTNLQGLRALAALGVVVFHVGLVPATGVPFRIGAAGVDLFFVLSGFIIARSASAGGRHFLVHRLIRVLPAYWIATLLAALFTLQALSLPAAAGWLLRSLLYLPGPAGRPVLIFVAWTLVYELAFYLLYWLALRFGPRRAPWVALVLLIGLAVVPVPGAPGPWPLLLEFAMGLGVYLLAERAAAMGSASGGSGSGTAGLAIAGVGFVLLVGLARLTGYDPDDYQSVSRVLCWGLPAAVILAGLVLAERGGRAVGNRPVLLLGAASYALYLLHPIALGQLIQLRPRTAPASWLLCAAATVAITLLALAFHLLVEAPLLRRLRGLLRDDPPVEQRMGTARPGRSGRSAT